MHEVLVNRLGGLSLPRKSVVRLTDRPDMTLDVYRGRKTTMQHAMQLLSFSFFNNFRSIFVRACRSVATYPKIISIDFVVPMAKPAGIRR